MANPLINSGDAVLVAYSKSSQKNRFFYIPKLNKFNKNISPKTCIVMFKK